MCMNSGVIGVGTLVPLDHGAGTSVPSNEIEQGVGTLVPLSYIKKNGTEVPAPRCVKVNGTEVPAPMGMGLHLKVYTLIKSLPLKVRFKSDSLGANE